MCEVCEVCCAGSEMEVNEGFYSEGTCERQARDT